MSPAGVTELHRIGVKCLAREAAPLKLVDLIPVFQRWIQAGDFDDLPIDVADYSHVHHGPGVLLVGHSGNYCYEESGGRRGMVYYAKRPVAGGLDTRLAEVAHKALEASRRLAAEAGGLAGLHFPGNELVVFANDRRLAPNTDVAWAALEPPLRTFLERLYPEGYRLAREEDPNERLAAYVSAPGPVALETLLMRLC